MHRPPRHLKLRLDDCRALAMRLTPAQHGVHVRLLAEHCSTGQPLPLCARALYALANARSAADEAAVRAVLAQQWVRGEHGWTCAPGAAPRPARPRRAAPPNAAPSPVFIAIPVVGDAAGEAEVTEAMVATWEASYPGVDVRQQLRHMREWSKANPARRKTARGLHRFITAWLAREQDRGGRRAPVSAGAGHPGAIEQFRRMRERGDL